jgi:hypothetical protein
MATHLDENTAAADAADIADEIAGGLEADDETTHLAAVWNGLVARGDELGGRVHAAERRTGRARARLNVVDSRWDATDSAFSRRTLDEAGGDTKEAPYKTFYGKASASEVNSFGVQREIEFGRKVVDVLAVDASSPLTTEWSPRWVANTDALETAAGARDAAVRAEAPLDAEQTLYINDINLELDRLEGDLKKLFPGQPKRVSAFLAPTRATKRRKAKVEDGGDGT